MREEWATIIAHDLRQPIGVIALRSALLQRARLSDQQLHDVQQIHASAEHLRRMTSDLMDASLLETRRMQLTLERLDLCQFLRDVVQRVPVGAGRIRIQAPSDARLCVKGDAQRLEQVLTNLLSNAVKYGAPETDIGLELRHAHGNAEILVTNQGAGIPPDERSILFDRYVRSRAAKTGTTRGLGLGLYIARGLVEAHKGHIWAESVPGGVTTLHVSSRSTDRLCRPRRRHRTKPERHILSCMGSGDDALTACVMACQSTARVCRGPSSAALQPGNPRRARSG